MKKYIGLIIGLLPFIASAQLVITANNYVVLSGGSGASPTTLVLTTTTPAAISNAATGWIISENEFNQVLWPVGTNTGSYVVPFGYSTTEYLPLTCDITGAGVGSGVLKFSTYHGANYDNGAYKPSDVTNVSDFGATDYSVNMVDRFWDVDANTGYSTKPTLGDLTLTYINSGGTSEAALPNYIVNAALIAQRFNTNMAVWDDFTGSTGTYASSGITSSVSSGAVSPTNLYRSWTVANDSSLVTSVQQVSTPSTGLITWPNPALQTLNVKFGQGQEGDAIISIVNVIGQELMTREKYISQGMILPLDISNLPAAMYFVRVSTTKFVAVSKFVKQ